MQTFEICGLWWVWYLDGYHQGVGVGVDVNIRSLCSFVGGVGVGVSQIKLSS